VNCRSATAFDFKYEYVYLWTCSKCTDTKEQKRARNDALRGRMMESVPWDPGPGLLCCLFNFTEKKTRYKSFFAEDCLREGSD
jgi:hypothetical protein